jgi:hypothetical protein
VNLKAQINHYFFKHPNFRLLGFLLKLKTALERAYKKTLAIAV